MASHPKHFLVWSGSGMASHPPIPIAQLAEYIAALRANDGEGFSREYESIEPGQPFTWDASSAELNKAKNRYANVVAYDHSRVELQPLDGIPSSDYINANYLDGYCRPRAYVATQVIWLLTWFFSGIDSTTQARIVQQF